MDFILPKKMQQDKVKDMIKVLTVCSWKVTIIIFKYNQS